MELQTLTEGDVIRIHEALIRDFEASGDPIYPPGVTSSTLLGSAVARQHCGSGSILKYPDPIENAATLLFGICCDHPFHNGNKRTAIVSMLVHLDKNRLTLSDTSQKELYDMVLNVAKHTLGVRIDRRAAKKREVPRRRADAEVEAIIRWLRPRVRKVVRGEKPLTYRQLHAILKRFDYDLKNPKGNSIDIVKLVKVRKWVFGKKNSIEEKRVASMPYPRDGAEVPVSIIKFVRESCRLREEDGVDSTSFYEEEVVVDAFINKYRTLLRRLARM